MSLPVTPFEAQGHLPPWTTPTQEADYITALLAAVPTIGAEQVGDGTLDDPIWMYKIGTGPTHVLIVSYQHANEPVPREATLTLIRDLATSTDPDTVAYLQQVTVLVIPTPRPDGQTIRWNPNGVDTNRDHVHVSQDETMAIQRVISDYQPHVLVDAHEGRNITNNFATSKALNQNVHPDLLDLSHDMEQAVKAQLEGDGWTWEPYQNHNIYGPEYLASSASVRHAVGLLIESRRYDGVNEDAGERYTTTRLALARILSWHAENRGSVATAVEVARQAAPARPEVWLVTGTGSGGPYVQPAPDGYLITEADEQTLARPIAAFDLTVTDHGDDRLIDARGVESALVHYLANPLSDQSLVSGVPYYTTQPEPEDEATPVPPWPHYYVLDGGRNAPVVMVRMGTSQGTVTVWP